jgi:hypothetical protein
MAKQFGSGEIFEERDFEFFFLPAVGVSNEDFVESKNEGKRAH